MRALLVLLALLAAAPRSADACAVGSPCLKYKRPPDMPAVIRQQTSLYTRRSGGAFRSFTRSKIVAFLTGAQWDPPSQPPALKQGYVKVIPALPIRFVEAEHATRTLTHNDVRLVLVRRIEYRKGVVMIEVDNQVFALAPCDGKKRMCLSLRNDLSFDTPVEDEFAQPPLP